MCLKRKLDNWAVMHLFHLLLCTQGIYLSGQICSFTMNLRGQNSVFQTLKEKRDLGETRKELATELVQSPLL